MNEDIKKQFPHEVNGVHYSDKKVLSSAAGYYIGTTCWEEDEYGGLEEPGSRESGYFTSYDEAAKALESMHFAVRDCVENDLAYKAGLPRLKSVTDCARENLLRMDEELGRES